jgi:superfamily II DNA or RNA helicase
MNKLQQGLFYEEYILNIIKDKYKFCYLWKNIPTKLLPSNFYKNDKICDDIGCDIIGIKEDNNIDYIQCKNYSTTNIDNVINICDLAGFYNFVAENNITNPIVYYTGKLSQQILCRQNKIKYINVPYITNKNILKITPRDYQIEAYNNLKDNKRSILSMPCGTGKTLVSYLLSLDYKNVIILTPLISTTEQIMTHFKNYYNDNCNNYILINCKAERNINNIELTNKNIIASTYDSCDVIIKLLNKINIEETLIIIDEFHNISQDMIINKKNNMNKILTSDCKILFVSATPLNTDNYKDIFGDIKYELTWLDAINNKYICDYNFYYPDNDKIITKIDDLKIDKTIIEKTILINKSYFLLESLKLTNVKKCIVYLKTIKECCEFVKILKTINIYFELNLKVYEITCEITNKKRTEYLNKFKNDNNAINIICNVHVLDEGIDIPECDSVYLTHPNNNIINIIQRISRANRLDPKNKDKIAKIFLWSKNEIKLKQITDNISKTIKIKYGKDNNDITNKHNKPENNIKLNNNINNIDTKFTIGGELDFNLKDSDVAKYLDIQLLTLRERLSNKYSKNKNYFEKVDYIKIKNSKTSSVTYMLNYQCFERLAMLGNLQKSEIVRNYFVKLQ